MEILKSLSVRPFAVVGHRGAAGECFENTLECVLHAQRLGVDAVEIDLRLTADGEVILLHDPTFKRVAGVDLSPSELTLREIKQKIRLGSKFEVPTLAEVLEKTSVPLLLELKEEAAAPRALEEVLNKKALKRVAFISFLPEALRTVKGLEKDAVTGLIYADPKNAITEAKRLGCRIVLPRWQLATPKAVAFAHRLKLKVVAWVVNDKERLERVVAAGCDAVATDVPSKILELRSSLTFGRD